jgi:two-component system sensor histidine kinase BaeS
MAEWITRPLKRYPNQLINIAEGKYDPIPIEGPREVQQLARSMNDMSGKVENSLKSQRDFVANVSHEF